MAVSLERLARNQALYREVNERIVELLDAPTTPIEFLCECSNDGCAETVSMTLTEYELVRAQPTTFAVVPGHEILAIERVVEKNHTYLVVDKVNGRKAVAEMAQGGHVDADRA
jgi:hypothetical protein